MLALLAILAWASFNFRPCPRRTRGERKRFIELERQMNGEAAPDVHACQLMGWRRNRHFRKPARKGGDAGLLGLVVSSPAVMRPRCWPRFTREYRDRGMSSSSELTCGTTPATPSCSCSSRDTEYPNGIDEGGKIAISYGVQGHPGKVLHRPGWPDCPQILRSLWIAEQAARRFWTLML